MARYNLGKVRIIHRGEYNATITYKYLDAVNYKGNTYMYYNQNSTSGNVPSIFGSAYWTLLAGQAITVVRELPPFNEAAEGQVFGLIVPDEIAII